MSFEIRVPTLGESVVEATINQWLKQEGEHVAAGDPLLELETDKVNLEIPAEHAGVLVSIARGAGETVTIGDMLGIIDMSDAPPPDSDGGSPAPSAETQDTPVHQDTSPAKQDDSDAGADVQATPVALRMAADHQVDIRSVTGSGPGGRVTKDDMVSHLHRDEHTATEQPVAPPPVPETPSSTATAAPASLPAMPPAAMPALQADERREERVKMSRRRQTIAQRLVEAQQTAAMLTTFNEIDMSAVMDVRKRRKDTFKDRHNVGLGFMSFFVKAVVGALKSFPLLNAEIQDTDIVIKHYYDIGIAVGTEQGLVVPVLRDADRKTFAQIEQGIGELAERARTNTLTLQDLQGGTFSITNGGIYGSLMSTPILNAPQVGILGMHKIEQRPVVVDEAIDIRPMMYVALSYDHRIVDGSEAVRCLVRIKELIEDPEVLLLEG